MPRAIHFLVPAYAMALDIAGPMDVFITANQFLGKGVPPYQVEIVATERGLLPLLSGVQLSAGHTLRDDLHGNTLIVVGGADEPISAFGAESRVQSFLRAALERYLRVVSICNGALVLAQAGLLDSRRATTHWDNLANLRATAPSAKVCDDALYVQDGRVFTSAGVTSGIDLALYLVEQDCGREVALKTARQLVVYLRRPGGQRQFSEALPAGFTSEPLIGFGDWLHAHLAEPITLDDMAVAAGMSRRNFTRVFRTQTGTTPSAYLECLRVETAAKLLAVTALSVEQVAHRAGFGSEQRLRRSFSRRYGVSPGQYRASFGSVNPVDVPSTHLSGDA